MKNFKISPIEIWATHFDNRQLISALVEREIIGRYRGSFIGIFWPFFSPLLMLLVYTFVFSGIFKVKWGNQDQTKLEFALILFIGLMVFKLFSECIESAPNLIIKNVNYVKKIVFPLELLPTVVLCAALFHFFISLLVWLLVYWIFVGVPKPTIFLLPLVILPLVFMVQGFTWIFSSLGVYLRDISQLTGVFTMTLMFLSPVFYSIDSLPKAYQYFFYLNPLTIIIEQARDVLYFGKIPNLIELALYVAISVFFAWLSFVWFQKTRKGFADVL